MKQIIARSKRTPIYRDTSFVFSGIQEAAGTFDEEIKYPQSAENFIYTRYGNPGVQETEMKIAALEKSRWALLTASGMSAIDLALSIFQKGKETGTWLFFSELYGGTNNYIDSVLVRRRGIDVERFFPEPGEERYNLDRLAEMMDRVKPKVLYLEVISNPLLIVVDGDAIIRMAKERGIAVIIDNTFGTPQLWRPLEFGADLVIHSATKYMAGHGNVTAGVVCGNDDQLKKEALIFRKYVGPILSPDDAYRLSTQLETFDLRYTRQCENAMRLAQRLEKHEAVAEVRYPGLSSHCTHEAAHRLFKENGYGAMINFNLKGGRNACDTFVQRLNDSVSYTPTLGDAQSIMLNVPATFGEDKYPYPGMMRFSVGFEPYDQLENCILNGLRDLD